MQVLYAIGGVLGFAAVANAAPALSNGYCIDTSTATVYLTVPAAPSTVYLTIHAASSTDLPTITQISTIHSTIYLTQAPQTTSSTQTDPCEFVVDSGSTHYFNCPPPATSQSIVVITSSVTVYPVQTPPPPPQEHTSTTTVKSAVHSTRYLTLTSTISVAATETVSISGVASSSSSSLSHGTGIAYTGMAAGGWNITSASGGAAVYSASPTTTGHGSLVTDFTTFNIYSPYPTVTISPSTLKAASGFQHPGYSTGLAISSARSLFTTSCTETPVPYVNSTRTSSAAGDLTSSSMASLPTVFPTAFSHLTPCCSYAPTNSTKSLSTVFETIFSHSARSSTASYYPTISTVSKNATSTSSVAPATPTACGEHGNFTLAFDDIPPLQASNNTIQGEPVFNPYHQFDFSDGFTVVPPPTDQYLPSSKPLLIEFVPKLNINGTNPVDVPNMEEFDFSGQISDGDHGFTGCFHFNIYGGAFGCDSTGPDCDFTFSGYQYNLNNGTETLVTAREYAVPACPALENCTLTPITLDASFQNLTHVRINATAASEPKMWFMDDLRLGWFDNSCKTSFCRVNTPVH